MVTRPVFKAVKFAAWMRIGLAHYNTAEEVERLLSALREIAAGA